MSTDTSYYYSSGQTASRRRGGFTLVELLVVMLIMTIMASIVLFALVTTTNSAKDAKTKATIAKINALIMPKYESYLSRRLPIAIPPEPAANSSGVPLTTIEKKQYADWVAGLKLSIVRELMRLEMPERWTDVDDNPKASHTLFLAGHTLEAEGLFTPTATQVYRANKPTTATREAQGAECLYLIVTKGLDEPDVMENFAANEIGDTDGDGAKEFIDGWGKPIEFLRWPAGYRSELQNGTDPDPFDPRRISNGWLVIPLIYSAGPNGMFGVLWDTPVADPPFQYSTQADPNNPFSRSQPWGTVLPGSVPEESDNITNHLIGAR